MRRIMRPRRGLGMILNGNDWQSFVTHAFNALVVEIYVRDFDFGRQAVGFHRKAVIVRGDLDEAITEIFDRLVTAAMTKH